MLNENKILSLIISLTREIHSDNGEGQCFRASFMVPNDSKEPKLLESIGLEWYYTKRYFNKLKQLADMLKLSDRSLQDVDKKTIQATINNVIQNNALNESLFKSDIILYSGFKTLLEARCNISINDFAKNIYYLIRENIQRSLTDYIVLYPLEVVRSLTYHFATEDAVILQATDLSAWELMSANFDSTLGFNPSLGSNFGRKTLPGKGKVPHSWLVVKNSGTENNLVRQLELTLRKLIVLSYSIKTLGYKDLPSLISKEMPRYCIIFPKNEAKVGYQLRVRSVPSYQPEYSGTLELSNEDLFTITRYFERVKILEPLYLQRFEVAVHFMHYGMLTYSNIQQFINFYISLDALFGENRKVGESIKQGLSILKSTDKEIERKAKMLYKLRNAILHGGCSKIEEWQHYEKYLDQFGVDPVRDIHFICYQCILRYIDFASLNNQLNNN